MSKKETVLRQNSVYSDNCLLTATMANPANTEIVMDWRTYEGSYLAQSMGGLRDIDYLKDTEDVGVMANCYIVYALRIHFRYCQYDRLYHRKRKKCRTYYL